MCVDAHCAAFAQRASNRVNTALWPGALRSLAHRRLGKGLGGGYFLARTPAVCSPERFVQRQIGSGKGSAFASNNELSATPTRRDRPPTGQMTPRSSGAVAQLERGSAA